jgi:DNA-binding response OmpR family regulator
MPVLMVSGRGRERDTVEALDLGADDYLSKPFGVAELLARVKALLRREAPGPRASCHPTVMKGWRWTSALVAHDCTESRCR